MAPIHPRLLAQRQRIVARELQLAKALAGNDARTRNKVLKKLHRWLACRAASTFDFSEHDFMRLWKGLFYCVWMSDKPLVQEELCEDIAKLFTCFGEEKISTSILFYKCFLKTIANDWFGIDQHRIDKFLMLARRVTRGMMYSIKKVNWSEEATDSLLSCLTGEGGLFASAATSETRMCLGLQLHLVDCWMEEIAKVSEGNISKEAVTRMIKPLAMYVCYGGEVRLSRSIVYNIFDNLIKQTDLGVEYNNKVQAWKSAGFPGGSIDAMEKVEVSDDENEIIEEETPKQTALDPRAGRVDTVIPQLPVDEEGIASMFRELVVHLESTAKSRKGMKSIIKNFEILASGNYPFKISNFILPDDPELRLPNYDDAAIELLQFEMDTEEKNESNDLKGLSKSQKKRFLAKQRKKNILIDDEDEDEEDLPPKAKKSKIDKKNAKSPVESESPKDKKKNAIAKQNDKDDSKTSGFTVKFSNGPKNRTKPKDTVESKPNGESVSKKQKKSKNQSDDNVEESLTTNGGTSQFETPVKSKNKLKSSTPLPQNPSVETESKKPPKSKQLLNVVNKTKSKIDSSINLSISDTPIKMNGHSKAAAKMNGGETEIVIPASKNQLRKLNKTDNQITKSKLKTKKANLSMSESGSKKVDIVIAKNTMHSVQDYFKTVRQSPDIPYDGSKKPGKTSLKPNAMPSPVNPFYKKKYTLDLKSFNKGS